MKKIYESVETEITRISEDVITTSDPNGVGMAWKDSWTSGGVTTGDVE